MFQWVAERSLDCRAVPTFGHPRVRPGISYRYTTANVMLDRAAPIGGPSRVVAIDCSGCSGHEESWVGVWFTVFLV